MEHLSVVACIPLHIKKLGENRLGSSTPGNANEVKSIRCMKVTPVGVVRYGFDFYFSFKFHFLGQVYLWHVFIVTEIEKSQIVFTNEIEIIDYNLKKHLFCSCLFRESWYRIYKASLNGCVADIFSFLFCWCYQLSVKFIFSRPFFKEKKHSAQTADGKKN